MGDKFSLEYQYSLFLERMGLNESKMHPQQKKQLKETFIGACGQMIILLRDDVAELDEKEGVEVLQRMLDQVGNFFLKATRKAN